MRIEDNWEDAYQYYVEFQVKRDEELIVISKNIVLYDEMKEGEAAALIKAKFGNAINIKTVELYDDILVIKKLDRF